MTVSDSRVAGVVCAGGVAMWLEVQCGWSEDEDGCGRYMYREGYVGERRGGDTGRSQGFCMRQGGTKAGGVSHAGREGDLWPPFYAGVLSARRAAADKYPTRRVRPQTSPNPNESTRLHTLAALSCGASQGVPLDRTRRPMLRHGVVRAAPGVPGRPCLRLTRPGGLFAEEARQPRGHAWAAQIVRSIQAARARFLAPFSPEFLSAEGARTFRVELRRSAGPAIQISPRTRGVRRARPRPFPRTLLAYMGVSAFRMGSRGRGGDARGAGRLPDAHRCTPHAARLVLFCPWLVSFQPPELCEGPSDPGACSSCPTMLQHRTADAALDRTNDAMSTLPPFDRKIGALSACGASPPFSLGVDAHTMTLLVGGGCTMHVCQPSARRWSSQY